MSNDPILGLDPDTLAIRAGIERSQFNEHSEALYLTSSFVFNSAAEAAARVSGEEEGNVYARFTNPTVTAMQQRLAALEGAEACIATASGMAAIMSAVMALLSSGRSRGCVPRGFWCHPAAHRQHPVAFQHHLHLRARHGSGRRGLYKTTAINLKRVEETVSEESLALAESERSQIKKRIGEILQVFDSMPKSTQWKMRDKVGTRVRWYEEVEEVAR